MTLRAGVWLQITSWLILLSVWSYRPTHEYVHCPVVWRVNDSFLMNFAHCLCNIIISRLATCTVVGDRMDSMLENWSIYRLSMCGVKLSLDIYSTHVQLNCCQYYLILCLLYNLSSWLSFQSYNHWSLTEHQKETITIHVACLSWPSYNPVMGAHQVVATILTWIQPVLNLIFLHICSTFPL